MSDHESTPERLVRVETKMNIVERDINEIKGTTAEIFKKMDIQEQRLFNKIDGINHTCLNETELEDHSFRISEVETAQTELSKTKAEARGWMKAFDYILKGVIGILALYIAYKSYKG